MSRGLDRRHIDARVTRNRVEKVLQYMVFIHQNRAEVVELNYSTQWTKVSICFRQESSSIKCQLQCVKMRASTKTNGE